MQTKQENTVIFRAKNKNTGSIYQVCVIGHSLYGECNLHREDTAYLDFANSDEINSLIYGLQQLKAIVEKETNSDGPKC